MSNKPLIYLALLSLLVTFSCSKAPQPNILFILIDDLGKEWISTYGAEDVKTPAIDELARTGMLFDNAYSMPQCTPTRVSLLTGQYPWRNGWVNHYDVPRWGHGARFDPEMNPSFGKNLRDAGYKTCIAGKWQINDFRLEPDATALAGFDEYCMWTGGEGGGTSQKASQQRYWDPYIHTKEGSKTYKGEFGPDIYTDFIIDFMKRNKEKPMMIYFPMCLTHGPLTTTPARPNAPREKQHIAMVEYTDILLKRLTDALDELGIRENTIIIWTTDNGTGQSIIGRRDYRIVRGGKMKTSENGINAPFIVNWPGTIPEGIVTDALVDFTDMLPTFCELAGAKMDKSFEYDGISFAPLLLGEKGNSDRETIMAMGGHFAMLENDRIKNTFSYRDRVIRDKNYKAYVDTNGRIAEIIDFKTDFNETNNLIDSQVEEIKAAKNKFQKVLDQMPEKDVWPIYRQIEAPFYNHPADDLNKVAVRTKKAARKSEPVHISEYLRKKFGVNDPSLDPLKLYNEEKVWYTLFPKHSKSPTWQFVERDPNTPNVLIMGNSISIGYTQYLREAVGDKADVCRVPENCADTRKMLLNHEFWLGDGDWDLIHFNWGLHDLKRLTPEGKLDKTRQADNLVPLEEYKENLEKIIQILKKTGAKLIFATTTIIPEEAPGRVVGDEIIYNKAAMEVLNNHPDIIIDDQYETMLNFPEGRKELKDVHHNSLGNKKLGEIAAQLIIRELGK